MKIELHRIPIRELIEGYVDDAESCVRGCGGRLGTLFSCFRSSPWWYYGRVHPNG